jgi:hypothetical protein
MSRYYDLTVSTEATASTPSRVVKQWTSHPNGSFDPGAQNVEFDIIVTPYNTPTGGQIIRIEGISLSDLQQAQAFTGLQFTLKAGMGKGLPLANPLQANIITQGFIFQSFGNWEGTEMSLDFVVYPSSYNINQPGNIVLNWTANTPLSTALKQCLITAFPLIPAPIINISPNLILTHDEVGYYPSLESLAQGISDITQAQGHQVYITFQNGSIQVFDDTYVPVPVQIQFVDLIGQPTWINPNIMQAKLIMRADIQVGGKIMMPQGMQSAPGLITTRADSLPSNLKYKTAFQGAFSIVELRQLGNFRSTDGASWSTIVNCQVLNVQ